MSLVIRKPQGRLDLGDASAIGLLMAAGVKRHKELAPFEYDVVKQNGEWYLKQASPKNDDGYGYRLSQHPPYELEEVNVCCDKLKFAHNDCFCTIKEQKLKEE